jgi:Icc-related predicted phosphoesterase
MVKICVISDTHTKEKKLTIPECDILIHCGDFTWDGKYWDVKRFYWWLQKQPATYKVIIAGNHEITFDKNHSKYNPSCRALLAGCPDEDIYYLENSGIELFNLKIYGTPYTPEFYGWGFNGIVDRDLPFKRGTSLSEMHAQIPEDVQVLICHGPPYDILDVSEREDERTGSVEMRKLTHEKLMQLRLYLCGHIHEARGILVADGGVTFINAATLARDYTTIRPPVIVTLDEDGFVESVEGLEND